MQQFLAFYKSGVESVFQLSVFHFIRLINVDTFLPSYNIFLVTEKWNQNFLHMN